MDVRLPAAAGTLYEADTQRLFAQIESWLDNGIRANVPKPPKAIIVPHSGYHSSGEVAASAYRLLEPSYDKIHRVVVIGPSHFKSSKGLSLPSAKTFKTPLGSIKVDKEAIEVLKANPNVELSSQAHQQEHSIELQLPFLQTALEDFKLVPIVVGDCDAHVVAEVLDSLWGKEDTLIVISSGLSRKLSVADAQEQDSQTAQRILAGENDITYQEACGYGAINGLLELANKKGLTTKQIQLTNSFKTSGHKENVRGFGVFAIY